MGIADPRTHAIIGSAFRVHQELGDGLLETSYQDGLAIDFRLEGIPFQREAPIPLFYRGEPLSAPHRVDFLCFDDILVELKAIQNLGRVEEAQVIHSLKASRRQVALLINFGSLNLQVRRLSNTRKFGAVPISPASP